ncbi:MAG: hypothetical protein EOO52_09740 [Gammaproteobacteria bacterium]|nr:MAG: hypothetical protein EOO52_09740 [Gammaproteobacteria bacterium]
MANLSLTRVNQKLAQAKLLVTGVDEKALTPVHRNSLLEASAFHLVCAYQHYIREVAETYGLKHAIGLQDESDLVKAFDAAKKHPAEAEELAALRSDSTSWLVQLQIYYDSLWQVPKLVTPQTSEELIGLVDLDRAAAAPVTFESVLQWHSKFVALVLRQRETSAEF